MRPHAGAMALGLVWLALTNLCALTIPRLVNEGIARIEGRPTEHHTLFFIDAPRVAHVVGAIVVLAVVGGVVRVLSRTSLFQVGRAIERELRSELFAHLGTLSPSYFAKASVGDLMSRLTSDLTNVRLLAGFALLNALNAVIIFCTTLPLLFSLDAKVAGLSLIPFPLVLIASQAVSKTMFRRTRENQDAIAALTTTVQESLAGQPVVRAFSQEAAVASRFAAKNAHVYELAMRLAKIRLFMGPLMGLMASLSIAVALFVGGRAVADGELSVGDVVEINTRLFQLTWPTIALGFILSVWQRGKASLSRIHEVLAMRPEIVDGTHDAGMDGRIDVRGLVVTVGENHRAIDGVDLTIPAGGVVGIVGRNASGKSVLLKAISRQLAVARGQLAIDDVDVNDWHLRALHRGVGVVPEDGFLFSTSLRDNLCFGRGDATDEEVAATVDLVDLRRDVERFPDGLGTVIGERGVTLSGGQRQRVALGRALLARPRVLLLDDSLSAVDAETEQNIVAALRRGFGAERPPTTLIVSHRLSAVRHADVIIGLDKGRIVERGSHDELLARGGLYATLWGEEQRREELTSRLKQAVAGGAA